MTEPKRWPPGHLTGHLTGQPAGQPNEPAIESSAAQWLQQEYTIDTPENVTFGYEVAGIGSRFIGALIDNLILGIALFLLNLLLLQLLGWLGGAEGATTLAGAAIAGEWASGFVTALYILLNFLLLWGYYIVFELIWNGQTIGKRIAKTRVVRLNGNPAGVLEIVVRNLLRMVDFLPVAYGVGLAVMFFNRHARRLGDFAAGTLVIKEGSMVGLESVAPLVATHRQDVPSDSAVAAWRQRFPGLRRLTAADYELIQDLLARHDQGKVQGVTLSRLAAAIATKLALDPPARDWHASRRFLVEVAEAYRHLGG